MHISALISCFNPAHCYGAALESVLAQTYAPIELIVVDDGSIHESPAQVRAFADRGIARLHCPSGRSVGPSAQTLRKAAGSAFRALQARFANLVAARRVRQTCRCVLKRLVRVYPLLWLIAGTNVALNIAIGHVLHLFRKLSRNFTLWQTGLLLGGRSLPGLAAIVAGAATIP